MAFRWIARLLITLFTWSAIAPPAAAAQGAWTPMSGPASAYVPKFVLRPAKARPAIEREADFAPLFPQRTKAAAAKTAPAAPGPDDLAETDEVQLTTGVRALADSLGRNPTLIYQWVRNNVEFVPSYGAVQSSQTTLDLKRGNAFDIASLTIALLRASGISARYAYGTIEVPATTMGNWVGGTTTPAATVALLAQGGVPSSTVGAAGAITAIRMEHAWVEAYVDFYPSRGAKSSASTWVPIDPAYKLNTFTAGVTGATLGGFNAATLSATTTQGAAIDADGALRLNSAGLSSAYSSFRTQAQTAIAGTRPTATVGDILGSRAIQSQEFPFLLGTLPYKIVTLANRFATVPDNFRWKVRYAAYASDIERAQNTPLVFVERTAAAIIGHRITLTFAPITPSDQQALTGMLLGNPFPSSFPGYQVHMKAHLSLDGATAGDNGDFIMGARLVGGAKWFDPSANAWIDSAPHDIIAGETHAIVVAGNGVSTAALAASRDRALAMKAKLAALDFSGITQDDVTGEALNFAALAYGATVHGNARILRDAAGVAGFAMPSIFRASTVAAVTTASGAIQSVRFPGVALDALSYPNAAVAKDGNPQRPIGMQRLLGARASAYAHLIAERLFTDTTSHVGEGTSGVRAISRANDAGTKIFTVTNANVATVVSPLTIDAATKKVVSDAAAAGRRAAVTGQPVIVSGWLGAGYGIDDPTSGTTEYEITGRLSGAAYPAGGLAPLALAGAAITAGQGTVVGTNVQGVLDATSDVTTAVTALNADARTIPWSSWAGASAVLSSWWLAAIDDGAAPLLGASLATTVDGLVAGQVTELTGVPQPNNPPRITSQPVTSAATGQLYQYLVAAFDPDGDPLTYSLVSSPAGMSVSSSGLVSWTAPVAGVYEVIVRVSDGKDYTDQRYVLSVGDVLSLSLALSVVPQFVNTGDSVTITVATTGGRSVVTRTLTVDGAAVTLDANGQARITASGIGGHPVVATATDGSDSITQQSFYAIGDPADTAAPVAQIATPATDTQITTAADVVGTANDARLAQWTLSMAPAGTGRFAIIATGAQPVINAKLGRFDPTVLANGLYDVQLRAVDASGRESIDQVTYEVTESLKLGQFTVSFLDLSVEAAGIPVQVTRTYDTRRKSESLDFGFGWTVDYQNMKLQKNLATGLGWTVVPQGLQSCVRPTGKRKVSVTLPDGRVERFEAGLVQECALVNLPPIQIQFTPVGKTTSTLEETEHSDVLLQGGNIVDTATALPWNPTKFRLTTLERFAYDLDQNFGIVRVTEPNGNTLTYGRNGIVHSAGLSVSFTRDALGRIATVTDPNGKMLTYAYDAAGNLSTMTDRTLAQSVMKYDRLHTLVTFTDPRGTQLVRNEYDAAGRLTAQYDAQGNKIDLSARDPGTNKEVVKDRRGAITTYVYDAIGNVSSIVDANGKTTSYTYDARGNEATIIDPLGHTVTKTFDGIDNPLTEKDGAGNTTTYAFKPNSRDLTSITDARGNATTMGYSTSGIVNSITNAEGNQTSMGYDPSGNLTSLKDGAGNQSNYAYDAKGRRTQETDATGAVTTYAYDSNGNATTVTKTRTVNGAPQTITTTRIFDADGNVTSETDALNNVARTSYNALKKVSSQTDALGHTTAYGYDPRGYETSITHPDGVVETKSYDENGNYATTTDRGGHVTTNTYDLLNRLTKVTYADGRFIQNGYDDAGRLASVTDERGNVTRHEYDAAGRRTKTTDAALGVFLYEYDSNGNLTKVTDPRLNVTTHEYDKANRRTKTTYPITPPDTVARFETFEYDGAGRRTAWVDTAGIRTSYGYDGAGRLTSVTQPSPDGVAPAPVTTYGYDELGNKVSQTDALGHVTRWEYDALGRMTKRTLPGGQSESFTYDAVGNVASHTTFKGDTITFTYDTLNRVATKTVPVSGAAGTLNNTTTYSYTPTGQVASVLDTRGTTTYSYDARDRLTQGVHPEGWTVTYGYDAAGNRSSISTQFSTEAAKTTSFEYDAANRLTRTTSAEGEITIFGYDAAGNRTSAALSNGTSIAWTYDARNRLTKVEHRKVANNALIASHTYTWNAQGLRSREVSLTTTSQFQCQYDHTYDALGRLTQTAVSFPGTQGNPCRFTGTWTYGYDAVGNRLTESTPTFPAGTSSFTYDVNDRLTSVTGKKQATYEYDAGGNVTKQTLPAPNGSTVPLVTQYQWDPENRLVGFTPAVGQGEPLSYLYDADGELVRQVRQAATNAQPSLADTTLYLPDKNLPFSQILEERDGSGALKASYQYADGQLVKEVQSGVETFYHSNHLSVMALTDSTGAVVNHYNYSPFGEITFQSATTPVNGHLFAGERFDANLALYYLRARWMDPRAGKFEATDPALPKLLNPKTLNTYAYAVGDPVNHIDRTGGSALLDAMGGQSGMMQIALPAVSFAAGVIGTITYATLEKEKAKAKDCISRMRGSAIGPRPCPNTLLPIVFMSADRMPTIAAHVALAQPPEILSRAGLGQNVRNRLVAIAKCALGGSINLRTALNNSCDEYPFASSIEGGIALTVSTMWVPIAEQWSQGGVLAAFYAYCNVLPGVPVMNVFGVLPVASSPTSFQCAFR